MQYFAQLESFLFAAAATLLVLAGVMALLLLAFWRRRRPGHPGRRDPREDMTNMMILFQTMRDILEQQKDLARQLNKSLDKKVIYIRDSVDEVREEVQNARRLMHELAERVHETRSELDALKHELADVRSLPAKSPQPSALDETPPAPPPQTLPQVEEAPSLQALAQPEGVSVEDDLIDNWVGLDFAGDEPDPDAFDVPDEVPESPEDAEAARDAFRVLLDLESTPSLVAEEAKEKAGGNGHTQSVPLQARVYDYNDAGMSVSQISRQLGLGKGEIRLILSLRKDKGH
jgi:hypothetical protein